MIRSMEHKGEIVQPEGFLVVVAVHQVVFLTLLHRKDHHIIGDKGKEYLSVRFAYPLCFLDAPQFVLFLVQMIQRSKEQDNIKGITFIPAQIKRITLNQVNGIIVRHLCPEGCYVCIRKFQSRHLVSFSSTIGPVDAGIQGAMQSGVIAGYSMVDVKVTLYDGSYHEVDSSEMAFKIAGSMAFKDAAKKANPVLLEPIMKVVVITPEDYMGDVIGDLNSRRGEIQGFEDRTGVKQINARVPLAEMFGYATDLRSKTQGRGQYVMEPDGYKEVPKSIAESIVTERSKRD